MAEQDGELNLTPLALRSITFRGTTYPTTIGRFWESAPVCDVVVIKFIDDRIYDEYPHAAVEAELREILDTLPSKLIFSLSDRTHLSSRDIYLMLNAWRDPVDRTATPNVELQVRKRRKWLLAYFVDLDSALEAMVDVEAIDHPVALCSAPKNILEVLRILRLTSAASVRLTTRSPVGLSQSQVTTDSLKRGS